MFSEQNKLKQLSWRFKMKRLKLSVVTIFFIVLFFNSAFSQLADTPWPKFQHDARNSGSSPYTGPQNPGVIWKFKTDGLVRSSPAIDANGRIYIGSDDGNLYAINSDGSLAWKYYTGTMVRSSPAIDIKNRIYFVTGENDNSALTAVDIDGQYMWKLDLTGDCSGSSPNIAEDGTIYINSWVISESIYYLYAINPDGTMKWQYETDAQKSSYYDSYWIPEAPAIGAKGTIYVTAQHLYGINPDGTFKWKYEHYQGYTFKDLSYPSVGNGLTASFTEGETILFGCEKLYLTYLRYDGVGMYRWVLSNKDYGYYYPVTSPSNSATGASAFKCSNFTCLVTDATGWIRYVNTGNYTASSPVIDVNDSIYVGSGDGNFYAISADGTKRGQLQCAGGIQSSPAIGADGTIYVGCDDGCLYAIGETPPDKTSVEIYAYQPVFVSGDNLKIESKIDNAENDSIDFYSAALIDGRIFFYPGWNNELVPTIVNKGTSITKEIMNIVLPENTPVGLYSFFAAITKHGTFDQLDLNYITVQIE
jgi:outer membrane protein assembly factor BamB